MSDNGKNDFCLECNKDLLRIVEVMIGAIIENKNIEQAIAEEICLIIKADRCVYLKIFFDGSKEEYLCRMMAGVPVDGHYKISNDPLLRHKDWQEVFEKREILHIKDPLTNKLTSYFKDEVIVPKKINQILYIPVITGKDVEKVRGIIVIDSVGEKVFSERDVSLCSCIGKLISMTANREDFLYQRWKDRILNPAVSLQAYAKKIQVAAEVINDAVRRVEEQFEEDRQRISFSS